MAIPLAITYPRSGGKDTAKDSFAAKSPKLILDMPVPYSQWVAGCQSSTGLATMTITHRSPASPPGPTIPEVPLGAPRAGVLGDSQNSSCIGT